MIYLSIFIVCMVCVALVGLMIDKWRDRGYL